MSRNAHNSYNKADVEFRYRKPASKKVIDRARFILDVEAEVLRERKPDHEVIARLERFIENEAVDFMSYSLESIRLIIINEIKEIEAEDERKFNESLEEFDY